LGGCDLIIFSAGIGENAPSYRKAVIDDVKEALHLEIDEALNASVIGSEALISTNKSAIKVAVIPTDEEVMIARDCYKALEGTL
jgi:acetate kinase